MRRKLLILVVALAWNLIGVMSYLMNVTAGPEALAGLSEAERSLYTDIPAWATAAFAIAVFGGALGSIALLARKAWAAPVFLVSLVAIVVQMGDIGPASFDRVGEAIPLGRTAALGQRALLERYGHLTADPAAA